MARGKQLPELTLTVEENNRLVEWARRRTTAQALALRARIILAYAQGASTSEVAQCVQAIPHTVRKWRQRFIEQRLDGLLDAPRPGQPRKITDAKVEEVLAMTLERKPREATHWSSRLMAKASGLNQTAIVRIWRAFGLQPHRAETFKLSTDPLFIDKVRDIVGLYLSPPTRAVVLCVDEKSQIQALDRSQPVLPMMPGIPERRTHDYLRHGTTSLFAAFNIADGTVIGEIHRRHRAAEYQKFLITIDKAVPDELDVHIVCDNLSTHKTPAILEWLARHPRFHVHFTPTGSSWINQVERWFGLLTDQLLRRGVHKSVQALERDVRTWIEQWNESPKPFAWKKTADEILDSLAKYLQRISGASH